MVIKAEVAGVGPALIGGMGDIQIVMPAMDNGKHMLGCVAVYVAGRPPLTIKGTIKDFEEAFSGQVVKL